jgi:2-C-methyl-D-erythritol 2,4-cyclodiphosphate synthase
MVHAIVDALLGAAGLSDIGTYFSNQDPRWKNVSSTVFLKEVSKMFGKRKIKIINIDCVLLCEEPKIAPYVSAMKKNIAKALHIQPSAIGIKASTNERMGFIGRKQGMAATAVALVSH